MLNLSRRILDWVARDVSIAGDERCLLRDCLCHEQVIERIAMVHRQACKRHKVRDADIEQGETLTLHGVRDPFDVRSHLSNARLHDDFPERHHAGEDVVARILDQRPRPRSEPLVVR